MSTEEENANSDAYEERLARARARAQRRANRARTGLADESEPQSPSSPDVSQGLTSANASAADKRKSRATEAAHTDAHKTNRKAKSRPTAHVDIESGKLDATAVECQLDVAGATPHLQYAEKLERSEGQDTLKKARRLPHFAYSIAIFLRANLT